jgi:hypothetical protein
MRRKDARLDLEAMGRSRIAHPMDVCLVDWMERWPVQVAELMLTCDEWKL